VIPDVEIERCTLTVRHPGWSRGPDPRQVLDRVLPGLERAIVAALAGAGLEPGASGELAGRIALRITADGSPDPDGVAALARALRERLVPAGTPEPAGPSDGPAAGGGSSGATEAAAWSGVSLPRPTLPEAHRAAAAALARTLGRWSRSERPAALAAWPAPVAAAWVATLEAAAPHLRPGDCAAVQAPAVVRIAEVLLADAEGVPPAVRELILLGAVIAAGGDLPPDRVTLAAVRAAAVTGSGLDDADAPARDRPSAAQPDVPQPATPDRTAVPGPVTPAVVPVLPFLVVVQLYRIGYLDGLVAAAAAADPPCGTDLAAALAAALTATCLPPPGGGTRTPAEAAAVLAVAGLPVELLDTATSRLHRAIPAQSTVADAVLAPLRFSLAGCYAGGPAPGEPLALTASPAGWVLGERVGAMPIAWAGSRTGLEPTLDQLGQPEIREDGTFAAFATEVAARRAFPTLPLGDLERHLAAAAGTGLGALALALWPERARAADAPLLALGRLGDLEARVEVGGDGLAVAIPRGQRWLDLSRAGLLDAWPIPWAPAGRWELVTL
jgi:hypothetical protein